VPLFYKNKPAGEILVSIEFIPDYGVSMQNEASRIGTFSTIPQTTQTTQTITQSTLPVQQTTVMPVTTLPTTTMSTSQEQLRYDQMRYDQSLKYDMPPLQSQQFTNQSLLQSQQPILLTGQPPMQPNQMLPNTILTQTGSLPVSSERGFSQGAFPTNVRTEGLDELEKQREREEGFLAGQLDRRDEMRLKKENIKENSRDDLRSGYMTSQDFSRNQNQNLLTQNQNLTQNQTLTHTQTFPSENFYRPILQGSDFPTAEMIKSQTMYPGYTGLLGYQPMGYETRLDSRYSEQRTSTLPLESYEQTRTSTIPQQSFQQSGFQQQPYYAGLYSSQQQPLGQENIAPTTTEKKGLIGELTNIKNRITNKLHHKKEEPILNENYRPTGYTREREYLPVLPEGKQYYTQQQTFVTQIPGVISNPEARVEPMGKFVTHQGGTHSTVGSVQSHRIISRMADRPDMGEAALDNDARIALGDVPRSYYANENRPTNV
jgi:hypothetical protein